MPGKLLWKLDPNAIDRLAARLPAGAALVSATNGKTTTAAMVAEILRPHFRLAHNGSGANLVSGVASTLLAARDAELGLFEVDEGALSEVAARRYTRTRSASAISFATSSTATASSRRSSQSHAAVASLLPPKRHSRRERRRPPGRRPRATTKRVTVFGVGRSEASAAGAPARGRLEVLPPLRHAVRLRGRLRRPPRRLPLPALRARSASARRRRARDRASRVRGRVVHPVSRPRGRDESACACPASTARRLPTPSRPQRSHASWVSTWMRSRQASAVSARHSVASSGSTSPASAC